MGAGVPNAWIAAVGGLFGCVAFAIAEPFFIRKMLIEAGPTLDINTVFVDELLGLGYNHVPTLTVTLAVACAIGITIMEILSPWTAAWEIVTPNNCSAIVDCRAWPPW